jgi:hypothetical protein
MFRTPEKMKKSDFQIFKHVRGKNDPNANLISQFVAQHRRWASGALGKRVRWRA